MNLRDFSIGRKLRILMMASSSAALLLACIVLLGYDISTSKRATTEHLSTLVQIIADNSKAALSFGDQNAAGEILAALKAEPHLTSACIFDKQGALFTSYRSKNATDAPLPQFRSPGTYFDSGHMTQYIPMMLNGDQIGSVCIQSDTEAITQRYRSYVVIVASVLLLSWLIAFVVVTRMSRVITEPLGELIAVAGSISDSGCLEHKIDTDRKDEIGDLARSFSRMIEYLREMASVSEGIAGGDLSRDVVPRSEQDVLGNAFARMRDGLVSLVKSVRNGATQVANGSSQVASASEDAAKVSVHAASAIDEVTSTMQEMSVNVQSVVGNTQMQVSSVSETSASIEEMVASIQRVADTANVLLEISSRSRDEVQSGIKTMDKTTDGLSRINNAIGTSATIIGELGDRAKAIGRIIEVIDDIAEQTNLLALNAAIEAARAGEHGLGFAVVADEVRKLSERSAASTNEIGELINGIQAEARKAESNMQKSTLIVNEGLTLGNDLSAALRKISSVVSEVLRFAQEIGTATNEQSRGSSQIAAATTRLNHLTQEISSSVAEQAQGAQAVAQSMEKMRELVQQSTSSSAELAASAEQMSKMAGVLLESMDRFVVEERTGKRPVKQQFVLAARHF